MLICTFIFSLDNCYLLGVVLTASFKQSGQNFGVFDHFFMKEVGIFRAKSKVHFGN